MPELPEVENMCCGLQQALHKDIKSVYIADKSLREPLPKELEQLLINTRFYQIKRLAKYLIFHISNCNKVIIAHAGMSGRFIYDNNKDIIKHDHIIITFQDGHRIKYNDPRRFGLFILEDAANYLQNKYLNKIGVDALSAEFNTTYLELKLKNLKINIKTALLNQTIVAGVGNIYASEALYTAKISPLAAAGSLNKIDLENLVIAIKNVLHKSIKLGGSTLKDYKKTDGEKGQFQDHFSVYGKENASCPACLVNKEDCKIIKLKQNGRSTFYCSNIQNL